MALLPHDTLREIGKYWAGHRLHYTCVALYSSWSPDTHIVVTTSKPMPDRGRLKSPHITISRMPNGAYHGKCVAQLIGDPGEYRSHSTETIEYVHDRVVSVTYFCQYFSNKYNRYHNYRVETVIGGRNCVWCSHQLNNETDIRDMGGSVYVLDAALHSKQNVALCDYTSTASDMVANLPGSVPSAFRLMSDWGELPPGTKKLRFCTSTHLILGYG